MHGLYRGSRWLPGRPSTIGPTLHTYSRIRGLANEWFRNYLSERQQFVEIDGKKSQMALIQIGVPQGSILGPLLYLI